MQIPLTDTYYVLGIPASENAKIPGILDGCEWHSLNISFSGYHPRTLSVQGQGECTIQGHLKYVNTAWTLLQQD